MKHPLEDYMPKGSSRGELAWTKEMLTSEASKACEALAAEVVQMIDRSRK